MATLLGSIQATVMPDHCLIMIIGGGFDEFGHPEPGPLPLCWAGKDQIQLFSEIASGHQAYVQVEAWDNPAPDSDGWEAHGTAELHSISGTICISVMDERPLTDYLRLGPPGRYTVEVHATGRRRLRALYGQPAWYEDTPTGIERFRVRLWPVPG